LSVNAVTPAADTGASADARELQARRLLWRCRRGMKELDVLLERFAREGLPGASAREWEAFAELLALPDPLLAGYLLGGEVPREPHLVEILGRIGALCRSGGGSAVFCS
jgi:antitoxin CptB